MLLDLDRPDQPRGVTAAPAYSLAFSPDGHSFAYVADRPEQGRPVRTVYVQPVTGGEPVDLFEGTTAIHGVSGSIFVDRWVDEHTLAYTEGMGTGALELWLVNVPSREMLLPASVDYMATSFIWTAELGRLQDLPDDPPQWPVPPLVQGELVAFARANGHWYVSPLAHRAPHPLAKGRGLQLLWAPDARHIALIGGDPIRLQVQVNPAQ
ncbi:MAG TPA: hypothetical protein VD969_03815 [Symbiobacteriaceae bacterium]|nr:hypothetical protein [Symbiobacteriaceae bacterium]